MNRPIVCLTALLVLAGCATDEERAAKRAAADHAQCVSFGFKPGTDGYGNCRLQIEGQRRAAAAALFGAMYRPPAPITVPALQPLPVPPPPRTTVCSPLGGSVICNTN